MSNVRGVRTLAGDNALTSSVLKVDMSDILYKLESNRSRLARFIEFANKAKPAINRVFSYHTTELVSRYTTASDDVNDVATAIPVADVSIYSVGDIVKVLSTGEQLRVTGVDAANDEIDVVRGTGSTAADDIAEGDGLLTVSTSYAEASTLEDPVTTNPVEVQNYCQLFRDNLVFSGAMEQQAKVGGLHHNDPAEQRKDMALQHIRKINGAAYWGQKSVTTIGGRVAYTTGGIIEHIPGSKIDNSTTNLNEAVLRTTGLDITRYGSEDKTVFVSRPVAGLLAQVMEGAVRIEAGDTEFGVAMNSYMLPGGGMLRVIVDDELEHVPHSRYLVFVDKDHIRRREFRKTQLLTGRAENDFDGTREEMLTECGFEWGEGRAHGLMTNIQGAS